MKGFEQEALAALHDSMHHQKSEMTHELDRSNRGEPFVLHHLLRHGTSTPSALAAALHASSGRVSALLGALEKKGCITREIDAQDRRNILVSLTAEGERQAEAERDGISSTVCWVFSQMGERRTREFVDLVEEFMTYMSVCKPGKPRPDAETVRKAFEERAKRRENGNTVDGRNTQSAAGAGGLDDGGQSSSR